MDSPAHDPAPAPPTALTSPRSLGTALLRPQEILRSLDRGDDRLMLVLASTHGALLLPAIYRASEGEKFWLLWSNPITWVAVGVVVGLAWVQAIAFPAAILSSLFGGRSDFPAARTSVALSLVPAALLLFGYWLLRLAGQPALASQALAWLWPLAALWSLRSLRLCLMETYRLRRRAAQASSRGALLFGLWVSLAIGLIPFVVTALMMAINGAYDRF